MQKDCLSFQTKIYTKPNTYENVFIISANDVYVPMTKPKIPTTIRKILLTTSHTFLIPFDWYQYVQICMIPGKARPKADKHKAPKSDIKSSRLGIATARRTTNKKYII